MATKLASSKKVSLKVFKYRCFKFKQRHTVGSPPFCVFFAPAGEVLAWSDIERLGPGVKGVQRRENVAKRNQIKRFLSEDKRNTIPTAVTLAFDTNSVAFSDMNSDQVRASIVIKVRSKRKPGLVIDGQHRLLGISDFDAKMPVAVVSILDANDVEKAFQFLVINNKGSKVSKNHIKALALTYKDKELADRLKVARIAIDRERLLHVDILNSSKDSPFYRRVKFPSTPGTAKKVVPDAFERALTYIEEIRLPKLDDEDLQREFFASVWVAISEEWEDLFDDESKLTEKVGVICMTRYLVDAVASRADIEELDLDLSDFDAVKEEIKKLLKRQSFSFWTSDWKGSGYDTAIGHATIIDDLKQISRNLKNGLEWYTELDMVKKSGAD